MDSRAAGNRFVSALDRPLARRVLLVFSALALTVCSAARGSGFTPPENLKPGQSVTPSLDSSYDREAWLVYSYDIDTEGFVVDMKIHKSNGVAAVEQKTLDHVNSMQYRPATRDGQAVKISVGPIIFTWILDKPRQMSPQFNTTYETAWEHFNREEYDKAFELAAKLKNMPARNAFEEVKFQILAASLASRWDDENAELAHLKRIVEFQSLADKNRFKNPYVEEGQYLLILERIHSVQLGMMMLADGELTLNSMIIRGRDAEVTRRAQIAHREAGDRLRENPDVTIAGELTAIYREGQGVWKTRLFRDTFSVSDVKGSIATIHLSCEVGGEQRLRYPSLEAWTIPPGWNTCKFEAAGKSGTRFNVHQLAAGGTKPH